MSDHPLVGLWADAEPDEQTPGIEPQAEAISIDDIDVMLARIKARMLRDPEMAPAMFKSLTILQAAESADKVPIEPMMVINWPQGLSDRLKNGIRPGALMFGDMVKSKPMSGEYMDKIMALTSKSSNSAVVMPKLTEVYDYEASMSSKEAIESLTRDVKGKSSLSQHMSRSIRMSPGGIGELSFMVVDEAEKMVDKGFMFSPGYTHKNSNADKAAYKAKTRGHKHPGKGW